MALRTHNDQPSAARQIVAAVGDLLEPVIPSRPTVFASELSRTELFRDLLRQMQKDPITAIHKYNAAALRFPNAGITPLHIDESTSTAELPLWLLKSAQPRARVLSSDDLESQCASIAPRAILMSGIICLAACDLFIQGTGGRIYDQVTEAWFTSWLGATLAPAALVTADVRLPLTESDTDPPLLPRAIWRAPPARHNPSLLRDEVAAARKTTLLNKIERARRNGSDPTAAFTQLHELLRQYRTRHADQLHTLDDDVSAARRHAAEHTIAHDRTWAFPLHEPATLIALRDQIAECGTAALGCPR